MIKKIFIIFLLFFCISANAIEKKDNFSIEMLEKAQASGKTIVINSYEIWCGTCSAQTKVLNQAKKEFKQSDVQRVRNLVNKDFTSSIGIKITFPSKSLSPLLNTEVTI